jgi:hypothetical protein
MKPLIVAALSVMLSGCQSSDERKLAAMIERKVAQTNLQLADIGQPYIYRARDDARMACVPIRLKNQWEELQPEQRVIAWYIPRTDSWHTDNFRLADDGLSCEQYAAGTHAGTGRAPRLTEVPSGATATRTAQRASLQAQSAESGWGDGDRVRGSCSVAVQDKPIMSGSCSGVSRPRNIVLTAESSGCTVELIRTRTGAIAKIYAYRDICWLDEAGEVAIEADMPLGAITFANGCWSNRQVRLCVRKA